MDNNYIQQLEARVKALEDKLSYGRTDPQYEEFIQDMIFLGSDPTAVITTTEIIPNGGKTINVLEQPTFPLKIKYRGNLLIIPAYKSL